MLIPCPPFVLIETSSKSRRLFDNDDPSVVSITFFLFFLSLLCVCLLPSRAEWASDTQNPSRPIRSVWRRQRYMGRTWFNSSAAIKEPSTARLPLFLSLFLFLSPDISGIYMKRRPTTYRKGGSTLGTDRWPKERWRTLASAWPWDSKKREKMGSKALLKKKKKQRKFRLLKWDFDNIGSIAGKEANVNTTRITRSNWIWFLKNKVFGS